MVKKISPSCAKCPVGACYPKIKVNEKPPVEKAPNYSR